MACFLFIFLLIILFQTQNTGGNIVDHSTVRVFDSKPSDESVDDCDEEDDYEDNIV